MENVKLNFVILCNDAFVAKDTNSLNIIGIFDLIKAGSFPAVYPKFCVVTTASGNPGEYDQVIIIKDKKNGDEIAKLSGKLKINKPGQKAQYIGTFLSVVFPHKGEYVVEVEIGGELQDLTTNFTIG